MLRRGAQPGRRLAASPPSTSCSRRAGLSNMGSSDGTVGRSTTVATGPVGGRTGRLGTLGGDS